MVGIIFFFFIIQINFIADAQFQCKTYYYYLLMERRREEEKKRLKLKNYINKNRKRKKQVNR